ncbi:MULTISPECIES: peptidylprolyl isomerase [Halobacterium]|uniref:FKBP-type peptidyl-prolyl cis-trans isomerase n=1 Tax=Halobacterium TaxID=2239 RepID=UPI00073F0B0A|nr:MULTISPECIES: FKBP-type peptidyl-prolyl cis-trans isomerase [Halobacterium]MCG1003795.1 FKBP-type peptidyl-prolyl cis-trans isomerase [Halobacterium noricense]
MTDTIESGDRVRLAYVGRFENGSVFATSDPDVAAEHDLLEAQGKEREEFEPLTFTVGREDVIEGLDDAVVGMAVDEEAEVTVPPEAAYGDHDPDRVREYDPETFEGMVGETPEVGLHVEAENGLHGDVTAVTDEHVAVDFNHELAGKTLVFDVRVLAVE